MISWSFWARALWSSLSGVQDAGPNTASLTSCCVMVEEVRLGCAQDAQGVDARIAVEGAVLGIDRGPDQILGHLAQGDEHTRPQGRISQLGEGVTRAVLNQADGIGLALIRRHGLLAGGHDGVVVAIGREAGEAHGAQEK